MNFSTDYRQSFWWSSLSEFGEEVLVPSRIKKHLSQQQAAKLLNLNQSEISRTERGLAKPKSIVVASQLCEVYNLSPSQRKKYLELIFGVSDVHPDLVTELLNNQINNIAHLNRSGFPRVALKQAENLRIWLEANINVKNVNNSQIGTSISHLLLEESAAWWDIVLPDQINQFTENLISRMDILSDKLGRHIQEISAYIAVNKGFHAYIKGDYHIAEKYFLQILESQNLLDELWRIEVLRASIVTFGKTNNHIMLSKMESKTQKLMADRSVSNISKGYIMEGLGRSFIDLDLNKSMNFLKIADGYIEASRQDPNFLVIRHIQLIRSKLQAEKKLNKPRSELLKIAEPALKETENSGFARHEGQILSILS